MEGGEVLSPSLTLSLVILIETTVWAVRFTEIVMRDWYLMFFTTRESKVVVRLRETRGGYTRRV